MGVQLIKLQAGNAVVYPSSYLHQVKEVTKGTRLVAVSWIQSFVRSSEKRNLLEELATVRDVLDQSSSIQQNNPSAIINNCYTNLVRM